MPAPIAVDDVLSTNTNTAIVLSIADILLVNDTDPDGDPLTLQSFTQPANGTLVDNGDGTLTYTPDAGFAGADTFTYIASDGTEQSNSANVQIDVAPPAGIDSDAFGGASLAPNWTVQGAAQLATGAGEAYLEVSAQAGTNMYGSSTGAARVMQAASNEDFGIEAKFLSTPTLHHQMQGLLIEQDASNWLRFDTYRSGSDLYVFAAVTVAGTSSVRFNIQVPDGAANYLRATRAGDDWTLDYSADGQTWTNAGSFSHTLAVTAVGTFAGSADASTAFTSEVDYFFNSAAPVADESGAPLAPNAADDALGVQIDTGLTIDVAADLLSNDSDPNGDVVSLDSFAQPANGTLIDNGDGTLTYTPNAGYTGQDSFTYIATDGGLTDTATVTIDVTATGPQVFSDAFDGASLDPNWTVQGTAQLATGGGDAFLEVSAPAGSNMYGASTGASRAMQAAPDEDFGIEAKFLTVPTLHHQTQGLLIEQDASNWLRFDTYRSGSDLYVFSAVTVGNSSSVKLNIQVADGAADYLRATRTGDNWALDYSADGQTWTNAGSFSHALAVSTVGTFAASADASTTFTSEVDYFFNTAAPVADEEGVALPPDAVDDALSVLVDNGLSINVAADLLSNDSDPNGDTVSLDSFTQPANGALVDNGDGTLTYTPTAGYTGQDSFTYTVTDGGLTDTATVTIDVTAAGPQIFSDVFGGASLDPNWTVQGTAQLATGAGEAYLEVSAPAGSDMFGANTGAARVMQAASNEDFGIEAKFLTAPTLDLQMQGLLIEQDASNWMRFDTYRSGSDLYVFAAVTIAGVTSSQFNIQVPDGAANYLRATRAGDNWTLDYSADGQAWTNAGSFAHALTVSAIGTFAGSADASTPFTSQVDYFFNTAAPLTDEEAVALPPDAVDDALSVLVDNGLNINVASDLLSNDSDPNGDTVSLDSFTQPTNGTLVDNGDGTLTYTPTAGYTGQDSFTYTATDGSLTDTATVTIDITTPGTQVFSDAFGGASLDPNWTVQGTAQLGTAAGEAFLEVSAPAGSNMYHSSTGAARVMQAAPDEDFEIEAKFLSMPTLHHQTQGLLIEQDASNWLRFDTYRSGSDLYVFAAVTVANSSSVRINTQIADGSANHLRATRTGDSWTLDYSADGQTWTNAGSFSHALAVSAVGTFAASADASTAFTSEVDYFFNTAAPVTDESGATLPPDAIDDALSGQADTGLSINIAADLLSNDSDPNGDALTLDSFAQPANGTLVDNGDGTLTYTPNGGFVGQDSFTYTVTDGGLTDTATVTIDVSASGPQIFSDAFDGASLDPNWTIVQGTAELAQQSGEAYLQIAAPAGSNMFGSSTGASRVMQAAPDEDFGIEAKFLSTPTQHHQVQGLLIEQDASNWMRFDTYRSGSDLYVFAAVTIAAASSVRFNTQVADGSANYLRATRTGDDWTLDYSADGQTWTNAGSFTHALAVSSVGTFAGSADASTAFTSQVDYFFNTAAPVVDDVFTPPPVAGDDALSASLDQNLVIDVNADLLVNDSDPQGDPLTITGNTQPANGTLVDNGDGTWTYQPNTGFIGQDTFTYDISDGTQSATATVTITVSDPTNDAPTAVNDTVNGTEDQPLVISAIGNDTDPNGDPLTVVSTSQPSSGTVQVNPDQTITYTPNQDSNGADSFTYTITDGRGGFSQATVDVNIAPVADAPVGVDDNLSTAIDTGLPINVLSDLLANDFDPDGDTISFVGFSQPTNGALVDNGDGTLTYTPNAGFQGTDSFTYDISDGALTSSATVNIGVDNTIVVWYGDTQKFGQPGEAQQWVNILGEVDPSTVASLSYSLNGGPERALSLGPDQRRLQNEGDFNIDIDYVELDGSSTDDVVTIRATLNDASVVTKDVIIDYEAGSTWSSNYSIDWSTVTDPQDVLQIVDGKWSFDANGIRTVENGYDRFLTLGDGTWDNYEVSITATMHDVDAVDPIQNISGGMGFGMLWQGHTDDPIAGFQPKAGFLPLASFFARAGNLDTRASDWATLLDRQPLILEEDHTYEFKIRIEQVNVLDRMYSFKVWEAGTAEPTDWFSQEIEQFSAPTTGSFSPFVHFWDVTFGDITVTEIEGNDIIPGQDTSDVIVAVNTGDTNPGLNEIDVLSGGAGSDTFVFGEAGTVYYDDGVGTTDGEGDYALIWDFETGIDQIQLVGTANDYVLSASPAGLHSGTAIYRTAAGQTDELLGIVNDTSGLSLASNDFLFDDTIV